VPREALVVGLDEADRHRAEHGARQVADAAENGSGEGDQPELEARVVAHLAEVEGVEEAGGARERARDHERERDGAVDVDPHHRGGVTVLGGRAHRFALLRSQHEPHQREEDGKRHEHDDELLPRVRDAVDREDVAARQDVRDRLVVDVEEADRDVLEDERHADRRDQRREPGRPAERPVRDELDRDIDEPAGEHGDGERSEERRDERGGRRADGQPERVLRDDHRPGDHPAEHEHVTVREVDQLEDAVHERVAERDERVDRAVRQPDERDRREVGEALVLDVLREQEDEPEDQERREKRHRVRRQRPLRSRRRLCADVCGHGV
jgi:hypothetical protein